ncbi:hypothetical protein J437_LFUL012125 [Ladona fulva]|uniref:Endonuclease/exonuclease/phosphatase domain-containing protein n=1 Tax=Ladona fulva TaxID=123851 RepID=A0A8K0P3B6_LADFU|nr:hypothetical protein J437_LFUL012125 [Ladona fulva]
MDLAAAVLSFQERNIIRRIVICSSYLPYDTPDLPPNRELEDLVNFCKTKSWDLLVGCDSNSHHSVSGSSDVNPRGESLLEYLMTIELQLLNRGSQPTFRNNIREESGPGAFLLLKLVVAVTNSVSVTGGAGSLTVVRRQLCKVPCWFQKQDTEVLLMRFHPVHCNGPILPHQGIEGSRRLKLPFHNLV